MRVLWLAPQGGYSEGYWKMVCRFATKARIDINFIQVLDVSKVIKDLKHFKTDKSKKKSTNWSAEQPLKETLTKLIAAKKFNRIVINDPDVLPFFSGGSSSLSACRGSVFNFNGLPVHVIDDVIKVNTTPDASFLLEADLMKLRRWQLRRQRKEPKFKHRVLHKVSDVVELTQELIKNAAVISLDIETGYRFISCISITAAYRSGKFESYVIPFYNNLKDFGTHWDTEEDEVAVWTQVGKLLASDVIKVFQNGCYDNAYFLLYQFDVRNYFLDTMHMFHSIWTELPKSLDYIASYCLDYVQYWKDDLKSSKEDSLRFKSQEDLNTYWRYAALDTHYTMLSAVVLVQLLAQPAMAWALQNYNNEFANQLGMAFQMSMTGLRVNSRYRRVAMQRLAAIRDKQLETLRIITDDPEFNPNSSQQVAEIIYDVFKAKPLEIRGKDLSRSTDEKSLKFVKDGDVLVSRFVDTLWSAKKASNLISNYGEYDYSSHRGLELWNDRLMYNLSMAGTETGRAASNGHMYWIGRNAQNIPMTQRSWIVPDPGYIFFDFDYSQSDAWFVAFNSEDPRFIETMRSPRDTHCVHAAHFFKKTYEEIFTAYKDKIEWAAHKVRGVRAITKRLVHGSNFRMTAVTLYMTMNKEATLAAAIALGALWMTGQVGVEGQAPTKLSFVYIPAAGRLPRGFTPIAKPMNPEQWTQEQFIKFCEILLEDYHKMYSGLRPWFNSSTNAAVKNGNKVTCDFGRTRLFMADLQRNSAAQRELSAYYGQGGTAGNINRTMLALHYKHRDAMRDLGIMPMTQTHDSLTFQFQLKHAHESAKLVLTVMEEKFTIKGRELHVPAEGKFGPCWSDEFMADYRPDVDIAKTYTKLAAKLEAFYYEGAIDERDFDIFQLEHQRKVMDELRSFD